MAKSKGVCEKMHNSLKEANAEKCYLARVHGQTKFVEFTVEKPIKCVNKRLSKYETCEDGEPKAKYAKTKFEKVFYDKKSDTSLLKCKLN